jgi:SAM-dependent methyltransferase
MEYELALEPLQPLESCRVLDIGSPKLPTLLLARHSQCELYSTDIRDYFIGPTAHFVERLGRGARLGRTIHLEVQDARALAYPDGFFDRVFSISVLEHIPDTGDSQAMREIARVLKPGGIATITVPFAAGGAYDEFLAGPVYERQADADGQTFYQRRYDAAAVARRLVEPAGLNQKQITFFGEPSIRFEQYWNRIPMRWKLPVLWAQPFVATLCLKRLPPGQMDVACGVALTLEKPQVTRATRT